MALSNRTFRVFVSSTFSDFKTERDALQEYVFPRLRELAVQNGCTFQAIDLRWGISEEAALDQQTMQICLGEIKRCQNTSPRPNFIILLGDRYGWQPLPYEIDSIEFEAILSLTSEEDQNQLSLWYRKDDNTVPAVYVLQPRNGKFEQYEEWKKVEKQLRSIIQRVVGNLSLSSNELLKYYASATEQEIVAGAMNVVDAKEHVFGFFRTIQNIPVCLETSSFCEIDPQIAQMQSDLKMKLCQTLPGNIHQYTTNWQDEGPSMDHLGQFCEDVYTEISSVILAEVACLDEIDPLEREISSHETFAANRIKVFIGREDILNIIAQYISSTDPHPLIIWGDSGVGKSSLMAKAVKQVHKTKQVIVSRFIGTTPETSTGRALLSNLCKQITRSYEINEDNIPCGYKELEQEFHKHLALASKEKPLILFLDALDQLSDIDNIQNLSWIPSELPPNVHLVVSTLPGINLEILEKISSEKNRIKVDPLSMADGTIIIEKWLADAHHTLQENQKLYILDKFTQCGLPLYLKLCFEEAKLWKSYTPLPTLKDDILGMIQTLFQRLSLNSNHGKMIVAHSLGYLAASKNGLSEYELLDLLSQDKEVIADFHDRSPKSPKANSLPVVIWSRLYFDLEPYLTERFMDGMHLLGFYHHQMSDVCTALFRNEDRHKELAKYFYDMSLYLTQGESFINLRKVAELPYQLTHAGELYEKNLIATLSNLNFIKAKCIGKDVYELLADFDHLQSKTTLHSLSPVRKSIAESIGAIIERPSQLIQTIYNYLIWQKSLSKEIKSSLESSEKELENQSYWIRSLAPLPNHMSAADWRVNYEDQSAIQSISSDLRYIAISNSVGQVHIYDLHNGKLINSKKLDCKQVKSIAFCDKPWRFAWIDQENYIHCNLTSSSSKVKASETKILYHPEKGIIFVNDKAELVCWLPERETSVSISRDFPAPLNILKFTADGNNILYTAGNNSIHIGIIKWDDERWIETKSDYSGVPIVDLDYGSEIEKFAILQKNRCLSMLDLNGEIVAQTYYEAESRGRIIGTPSLCTINQVENTKIYFINTIGQLSIWNWQNDELEFYFDCCPSHNIQSFRILQTAQNSNKVYFSTEYIGGMISQSAAREESSCHQSEVAACVITPTGHVVSVGRSDNRLKWFTLDGLNFLNERTIRDISVINSTEEGDQVLVGDRNGCVWVQFPDRDTPDSEIMHVFNNEIKGVFSAGHNMVITAEEHGQVLFFDFMDWQNNKQVRPPQGAGLLLKILPAKDNGLCWALSIEVEGSNGNNYSYSHLELIKNDSREVIHHSTEQLRNFISSPDGNSLYLIGNSTHALKKCDSGWEKCAGNYPSHIRLAEFMGKSDQLIAVICKDKSWIEIWKTTGKFEKVAEAYLPEKATCLAVLGTSIVIGCISGKIITYHLEQRR